MRVFCENTIANLSFCKAERAGGKTAQRSTLRASGNEERGEASQWFISSAPICQVGFLGYYRERKATSGCDHLPNCESGCRVWEHKPAGIFSHGTMEYNAPLGAFHSQASFNVTLFRPFFAQIPPPIVRKSSLLANLNFARVILCIELFIMA